MLVGFQELRQIAQLFRQIHHEFGVAIDFVDELGEHWDELFGGAVGAEELSNRNQSLYWMQFRTWVLTIKVIYKQSYRADLVELVLAVLIIHFWIQFDLIIWI